MLKKIVILAILLSIISSQFCFGSCIEKYQSRGTVTATKILATRLAVVGGETAALAAVLAAAAFTAGTSIAASIPIVEIFLHIQQNSPYFFDLHDLAHFAVAKNDQKMSVAIKRARNYIDAHQTSDVTLIGKAKKAQARNLDKLLGLRSGELKKEERIQLAKNILKLDQSKAICEISRSRTGKSQNMAVKFDDYKNFKERLAKINL